jgi:predicted ATPase
MQSSISILHSSHKLYGREREIELLLTAFGRVRHGATEAFFVSGNPGIGKTALIQEVRNAILTQQGYFISGKYDQLNKDMPYSAVIQAFKELVRQLLSQNQEKAFCLQERILHAVGANGQIIIDVIPEIEQLIGKQPAVSYTDPTESQNRFNRVMQKFVGVFARQEHPLALFLDDLQWVDQASLNLIKVLLTDSESKNLLIIGAFRDTEVGVAHPFKTMVDDLTKTGVSITATKLPPLHVEHVNTLIADLIVNASQLTGIAPTHPVALMVHELTRAGIPITSTLLPPLEAGQVSTFVAGALGCPSEQTEQLAQIVFRKTRGNPLFIGQMLRVLQEEKKLLYDAATGWKWNAEEIELLHVADSVIDLLVAKIHKLSPDVQTVLKFAACIGNRFDLETLAVINGKSQGLTLIDISPAIQEMLIIPLHSEYAFCHDRIQEAAYSLLSDNEKQEMHCLIGYFVLSRTAPENRNEKVFYIADQLNLGFERIKTPQKKLELAELNLMAGRKAKASTAFASAAKYLTKGIAVLPEDSWRTQYDLTLALHMECSEGSYLGGDFEKAERLFDVILKNAKTNREKAEVYRMWAALSLHKGTPREALQRGKEGLKLLGLKTPDNPGNLSILKELLKIKWYIGGRKPADLALLPQKADPTGQTMVDILMNMAPPAYFYNKKLLSLLFLYIASVSFRYGYTTAGPVGYAAYGFMIGSVLGNYQAGYEFAKLGVRLANQSSNLSLKAQCSCFFGIFINHWTNPLQASVNILIDGYTSGLESGNFIYGGYCAGSHTATRMFRGDSLADVQTQAEKYLVVLKEIQHEDMFLGTIAILRTVKCLKGQTQGPSCFSDNSFNEMDFLRKLTPDGKQFVLSLYYSWKLLLFYLFEECENAIPISEDLQKKNYLLLGMYYLPHHNFYYSLTLAALYPIACTMDKWSYWRRLKKNQKQMKIWAENCAENFLNKHTLVAAEMARVRGNHADAETLYDHAIILSRDNDFIQEQAIANELAGKYYLSRNDEQRARAYLQEARHCYTQWGAMAKVKHLEQKYPALLQSRSELK